MSNLYLVTYDISDDPVRTKIAAALSAAGYRVQFSVFTVRGGPAKIAELKSVVDKLIEPGDAVLFADLGPADTAEGRMEWIGHCRLPEDRGDAAWVL